MPREAENLVGWQYGTREVIKRGKSRDYGGYKVIYWKVRCVACGYTTEVQGSSLKRGAGCQKCRGVGTGSISPQVKEKVTNPQSVKRGKQMTVRQLMKVLSTLDANALVYIHLVGKEGHATRKIKDVSATRGHAFFVAELPTKIEPWKG